MMKNSNFSQEQMESSAASQRSANILSRSQDNDTRFQIRLDQSFVFQKCKTNLSNPTE